MASLENIARWIAEMRSAGAAAAEELVERLGLEGDEHGMLTRRASRENFIRLRADPHTTALTRVLADAMEAALDRVEVNEARIADLKARLKALEEGE